MISQWDRIRKAERKDDGREEDRESLLKSVSPNPNSTKSLSVDIYTSGFRQTEAAPAISPPLGHHGAKSLSSRHHRTSVARPDNHEPCPNHPIESRSESALNIGAGTEVGRIKQGRMDSKENLHKSKLGKFHELVSENKELKLANRSLFEKVQLLQRRINADPELDANIPIEEDVPDDLSDAAISAQDDLRVIHFHQATESKKGTSEPNKYNVRAETVLTCAQQQLRELEYVENLKAERDSFKEKVKILTKQLEEAAERVNKSKHEARKFAEKSRTLEHELKDKDAALNKTKRELNEKITSIVSLELMLETKKDELSHERHKNEREKHALERECRAAYQRACSAEEDAKESKHTKHDLFKFVQRLVEKEIEVDIAKEKIGDLEDRHRKELEAKDREHKAELESVRAEAEQSRKEFEEKLRKLEEYNVRVLFGKENVGNYPDRDKESSTSAVISILCDKELQEEFVVECKQSIVSECSADKAAGVTKTEEAEGTDEVDAEVDAEVDTGREEKIQRVFESLSRKISRVKTA